MKANIFVLYKMNAMCLKCFVIFIPEFGKPPHYLVWSYLNIFVSVFAVAFFFIICFNHF